MLLFSYLKGVSDQSCCESKLCFRKFGKGVPWRDNELEKGATSSRKAGDF